MVGWTENLNSVEVTAALDRSDKVVATVQRWESRAAAVRRVNLAKARLDAWPSDASQVRFALKNCREAVEFLERSLEPRRPRASVPTEADT